MNDQNSADKTARECRNILEEHCQCPAAETLLSYREDELAPKDAAAVSAHIGSCAQCAQLLEHLDEAEGPMIEDAEYLAARKEDRQLVSEALGFGRTPPRTRSLLDRFSWLWEIHTPLWAPAAAVAMLFLVLVWPAGTEAPVSTFGPTVTLLSTDLMTRSAPAPPLEYRARVNDLLLIKHIFYTSQATPGTMVYREIIGPDGVVPLDSVSVSEIQDKERKLPGIEFPLTISVPGSYRLRLSHPAGAFPPVTMNIKIVPPGANESGD